MNRPCLGCGALIPSGSYCNRCGQGGFPNSPGRLSGRRAQVLRREVLRAFAFRCAECGVEGKPLQVNHVDHNHRNNHPTNLVPLCGSCHTKAGMRLF